MFETHHDQSNLQSKWWFCLKHLKLTRVLTSRICQIVFILSLFLAWWIVPATAMTGPWWLLVMMFMLTFAASLTCMVRQIKDQIGAGFKSGASWLSIGASVVGLAATQFCSVNAVMCGSTLGLTFLATILPSTVFHFLGRHTFWILLISISIQFYSLINNDCLNIAQCWRDKGRK